MVLEQRMIKSRLVSNMDAVDDISIRALDGFKRRLVQTLQVLVNIQHFVLRHGHAAAAAFT